MNGNTSMFVEELTSIAPTLATAYEQIKLDWDPDDPPITIVFAALGRRIVDDFSSFSEKTRERIFELIEKGMANQTEELSAAVATGIIEGMIGRAARSPGSWKEIRSYLKPLSGQHADAWTGG